MFIIIILIKFIPIYFWLMSLYVIIPTFLYFFYKKIRNKDTKDTKDTKDIIHIDFWKHIISIVPEITNLSTNHKAKAEVAIQQDVNFLKPISKENFLRLEDGTTEICILPYGENNYISRKQHYLKGNVVQCGKCTGEDCPICNFYDINNDFAFKPITRFYYNVVKKGSTIPLIWSVCENVHNQIKKLSNFCNFCNFDYEFVIKIIKTKNNNFPHYDLFHSSSCKREPFAVKLLKENLIDLEKVAFSWVKPTVDLNIALMNHINNEFYKS